MRWLRHMRPAAKPRARSCAHRARVVSSLSVARVPMLVVALCASLLGSPDARANDDDAPASLPGAPVPGERAPALRDDVDDPVASLDDRSSTRERGSPIEAFVDELADVGAWLVATEGYRVRGAVLEDALFVDQDARFFLDAGVSSFSGRLTAHVSALLFVDTDGLETDGGLYSVRDQRGPIQLLPQSLELRYADDAWVRRLSVGRFVVLEGWPMTVDGAALTVAPFGHMEGGALLGLTDSDVFVSAGRTAHFYEVDANELEDWSAQVGANLRVLRMATLQIDYRALFEDIVGSVVDHTYGARLTLRAARHGTLEGYARGLNAGVSRVGVGGQLFLPWDVTGVVRLDAQPMKLDVAHEQMNPYLAVLGPSMPWARAVVEVSKSELLPIGTIAVRGGWNHRARLAGFDRPFNRSYGRAYVGGDVTDLLVDGVFISSRAEYHYLSGIADDGVVAMTGVVGYAHGFVRVEAGSDYQRYKIVYYRDVDELVDVRTFFTSASIRAFDLFTIRADYQVEAFDRVVHTANISLVEDFALGTLP